MYAILHAASENGPDAYYRSAIAIFFAGFFDLFDGRIARLTKTQSEFGTQLDSLADVISFGAAPAVLIFKWALWPLGTLGLFIVFFYVACGAIRLARFNVMAAHSPSSNYFTGLPIPLAAALIVALVIAHFHIFGAEEMTRRIALSSTMIILGLLMVSTVPYWAFKNTHLGIKSIAIGVGIMLFIWLVSWRYPASVGLFNLISGYITAGLGRYVYLFFAKRLPSQ